MKTAEQIAAAAERFNGRANTAKINALYRAQDQSHLWPVWGKFDATERAIRRVRRDFAKMGIPCEGLDYAYSIDAVPRPGQQSRLERLQTSTESISECASRGVGTRNP